MTRPHGAKCEKPATTAVLWPDGSTVLCCEDHVEMARKVLKTLGIGLHARPRRQEEVETCQQRVER